MANVAIPNLPTVTAVTGTEQIPAIQNGVTVRLTASQIASLAPPIAAGTNNQIQYNNSGVLNGFTPSGDVAITPTTGVTKVNSVQANAIVDASLSSSSQIYAVNQTYNLTAAEISAGVTPTNYGYQPYTVERYGPVGNSSTGDDATFQAAINAVAKYSNDTGAQGKLYFSSPIFLASPKVLSKNIALIGQGKNFRATINPIASFSGSSLLQIDGSQCIGGYAFRVHLEGFTINNSLVTTLAQMPITIYVNSAYDICIRDVLVYNSYGTGIDVTSCNYVVIEDCSFYGVTATSTTSKYGINVNSGSVKIINPDVEVFYNGIYVQNGAYVDVVSPYMERNLVGWNVATTTSGSFSCTGGLINSPGASGIAANIAGNNVTVIGGRYNANSGTGLIVDSTSQRQNVRIYNPSGNFTDAKNYALRDLNGTTNWYQASKVRNYKSPTSGAATTFFNVAVPFNSAYFGVVEVTINARDQSGYSMWTGRYRYTLSNPDGTLRASAITEYGKANVNISGNYALAITTALSNAGTTSAFQITATTTGALGAGVSPYISTEAELVQWDSAGGVYIQAA